MKLLVTGTVVAHIVGVGQVPVSNRGRLLAPLAAIVLVHVPIIQESADAWKPLTIFFIRLTSLFTYGTMPAAPKARGLAYH